jgi:hypothetical protein
MPLRATLKLVNKKYGVKAGDVLVGAVASDMLEASNLRLLRDMLVLVSEKRLSASG